MPEQVYRSAMGIVFNERGFQVESEVKLEVHYLGLLLFFGPSPEFWRVVASRPGSDGR